MCMDDTRDHHYHCLIWKYRYVRIAYSHVLSQLFYLATTSKRHAKHHASVIIMSLSRGTLFSLIQIPV